MRWMYYLLNKLLTVSYREVERIRTQPHQCQQRMFTRLIGYGALTKFGKKHGIKPKLTYEEFKRQVPLFTYEDLYPYIERMMHGELDVLFPGKTSWFSKSSGTTNDRSKYIPVSEDAIKTNHLSGGRMALSVYLKRYPKSKLFTGKFVSITGSLQEIIGNRESKVGDVSAILYSHLPFVVSLFKANSKRINLQPSFEKKLEEMAERGTRLNVTSLQGVPSWVLRLIERSLSISGKKTASELWPNFELFVHGGVSFEPYRAIFDRYFEGSNITYLEVYNASEGFFAFQDDIDKVGQMLLALNHGIFFEFIPIDDLNNGRYQQAVPIWEAKIGVNYAIIVTTNAGLWRYLPGDTVKFTSIEPYRIKITGRTKQFINTFGEELMVDNAERALAFAAQITNAEIADYTVAPGHISHHKSGYHEWIIEFEREPNNLTDFTQLLDQKLRELNSDYDAKRFKDMAIGLPRIHLAPKGTFYKWLSQNGKAGAQNKVPRLSNARNYIDQLLTFIDAS